MVLSESLQAVVEAMHTSKAQRNQALSKMLRVGRHQHFSLCSFPWRESRAGEIVLILSSDAEGDKEYPIPPRETARVMYSVPLAMLSVLCRMTFPRHRLCRGLFIVFEGVDGSW